MLRVIAIIQARINSTRLPGKVLLPLASEPMLVNVAQRVKRAKKIDQVVIACPSADFSELALCFEWAGVNGFAPDCEESDLIGRYYECAKHFKADLVVRVCADNACIEPEAIDLLVDHYKPSVGTLFTNAGDFRLAERDFGWPNGIGAELYSMEMLEWMNKEIKQKFQREHPHRFFHDTHAVDVPPCPAPWARPDLKLDVDTHKDYEFIKSIYDHFGNNEFHVEQVIEYLHEKNLEEWRVSG